jgi:hypothetical protein
MRELLAIDRDIAKASDRLRALRKERQQWLWVWRNRIIDAFDDGAPMVDLAAKTGLSYDSIRAILYRSGRTLRGRATVRKLIETEIRP